MSRVELLFGDALVDHLADEPARHRRETSTAEEDATYDRLMEESRAEFEREIAGAVSIGLAGSRGVGGRLWGGGRR